MKIKKILAAVLSLTLLCGTGGILPTANAQNLGDVNNDSVIDSSDATVILIDYANSLLGRASTLDKSISDCNGDGSVDSSDATVILIAYANALLGGKTLTKLDGSGSGNTNSYKSAYEAILNEINTHSEYYNHGYFLFDIHDTNSEEGDGIPELITKTGENEQDTQIKIYTFSNNNAVLIGQFNGWHSSFIEGDDYHLYMNQHSPDGVDEITWILKTGNKINTEVWNDEQSKTFLDIYYQDAYKVKLYDTSDFSAFNKRF